MMEILFNICLALSAGLIIGVVFGGIKAVIYRKKGKTYSQQAITSTQKLLTAVAAFLKYFTFLLLVVGFVWCIYFLALGIVQPEQADYANNMCRTDCCSLDGHLYFVCLYRVHQQKKR